MKARIVFATTILAAAAIAFWHLGAAPAAAFSAGTDEQTLFADTNQDRTSNGVPALSWNGTLGYIARNQPNSSVCGFSISGRSQDMVNRNYFSHTICGSKNVFDFMNADGIGYNSAGENIGWTTSPESTAAGDINSAFMGSSEHRANILNSAFTQIGIGAAAGGSGDTCCGGTSEIMFTEDFIQPTGSRPPPPPPPPPSPKPPPPPPPPAPPTTNPPYVPQPTPTRNVPAPPPPSVPPAVQQTPNAPALSSPTPSPGQGAGGVEVQATSSQPGLFELLVNRILQTFLNF